MSSLAPGSRLGPYEISAKLGEGGMGEVYRAHDTKLKRDVAIKVLPAAFVADQERLARFEREAQLLAQLHHPNIASIFGMEESDGTRALVMELVEGPTLAERLEQGPLSFKEGLSVSLQIAHALEEAHEKGIVHRDLKPQNIKASIEGRTKVLDFGLAKALDPSAGSIASAGDLARSPTMMQSPTLTAAHGTQLGVILGTAAYMAPEQARGVAIDKRADIWAFGVVLFEMLTGKRLFEGELVTDVLADVLRKEIDFAAPPAETPPAIRRLLRRCLERNPKNRLHDIADARIVLEEVIAGKNDERPVQAPPQVVEASPSRARAVALGALLLLSGVALGSLLRRPDPPATEASSRWTLALPDGFTLSTDDRPQLALSRDGRLSVAVVVGASGTSQLLLRQSDEFEPKLLPETEGATSPFFSPDGAWIAYFRDQALYKVSILGGPPVRVAAAGNAGRGGVWSSDGFIYFPPDFATGLSRVAEGGGEVQPVTELDAARSERTHRWPDVLPDGSAVLFTSDTLASSEYYDDARIEAVRPSTGERKVLVEGASQARWAPGDRLVFARSGALYAVDFDPKTLAVRGSPRPVVQGVSTNVGSGAVQFAIAANGSAIWAPGGLAAAYRVVWVDRGGVETPAEIPQGTYNELGLSPDGKRVALIGGQGGMSDLWVADLERGSLTRLTSGEFTRNPIWSSDGSRIAYGVVARGAGEGRGRIDWRVADGSQPAETLVAEGTAALPESFPPGAQVLLFTRLASGSGVELFEMELRGSRSERPLASGPYGIYAALVSPDGRWLAYVSAENDRPTVYVRPFPRGGGRWQISTAHGDEPRWSRDGRELYFRADSVLYRVPIDTARGFAAGRPEPVFDRVASGGSIQTYALSSDGARILTLRSEAGSGAQRTLHLDLGFARRLTEPADARK